MNNKYEFKASSVDAAIDAGLKELNLSREDAEIEILSSGGFLKKAIVAIGKKEVEESDAFTEEQKDTEANTEPERERRERTKESRFGNNQDNAQKREDSQAKIFIKNVLELMNINCSVDERIKGSEIAFYIKGEDAHKIIGYRGETLDALQHLVTCKINKDEKVFERVVVDADFYRQKREQTLINLAKRLAKQAAASNSSVELEPMNAFERRIIHSALQDSKLASTRSDGEGKDRHIIITPLESVSENSVQYGATSFKKTGPVRTKGYGYSRKRF